MVVFILIIRHFPVFFQKCNQCSRAFNIYDTLRRHEQSVHSADKPVFVRILILLCSTWFCFFSTEFVRFRFLIVDMRRMWKAF